MTSDLDRLKSEYARRATVEKGDNKYTLFNRQNLFTLQQRKKDIVAMLERHNLSQTNELKLLEMGCGTSGVLLEFLQLGFDPSKIFGIDLLPDRLLLGKKSLPHIATSCANGGYLPFPDQSFDLVLQFTAFSSILDQAIQRQVAQEMIRVLHPKGAILWYDFWVNPTNKQTTGINKNNIKELFPNCQINHQKITLAPPITRAVVKISWNLPLLLEQLKFLNTHYLCLIRKSAP